VARLAALTGQAVQALNPQHGIEGARHVAVIDENWCIGCTLCLDACPTDAILGSNKRMHTVLINYCTGCELCIPVCPVDCIQLENASGTATGWAAWSQPQADLARSRYQFHVVRLQRKQHEHELTLERKAEHKLADLPNQSLHTDPVMLDKKRQVIEAALARARAKRGAV
jgi:electron transport complex protein RnfB